MINEQNANELPTLKELFAQADAIMSKSVYTENIENVSELNQNGELDEFYGLMQNLKDSLFASRESAIANDRETMFIHLSSALATCKTFSVELESLLEELR